MSVNILPKLLLKCTKDRSGKHFLLLLKNSTLKLNRLNTNLRILYSKEGRLYGRPSFVLDLVYSLGSLPRKNPELGLRMQTFSMILPFR